MATPIDSVNPCFAGCCILTGLYTTLPDCIGMEGQIVASCLDTEYKCCKFGKDEVLCVGFDAAFQLIKPRVCLKGKHQCFCLDTRCRFPCDEEVPCLISFGFLTCFYDYQYGCWMCKNVGQMKNPPVPPSNP